MEEQSQNQDTGLFGLSVDTTGRAHLTEAARWARFQLPMLLWKRVVALGYAILGAWLIKEAFRIIRSPQTEILQFVFDFFRGAVPNLWILFLAPWVLLKARLLPASDSQVASGLSAPE